MTTQPDNVSTLPAAVPAPRAAGGMTYSREGGITPTNFEEAWRLAQLFARSNLVPKDYRDQPENCLVAMQMGAEVGLKPLQALQGIAVINGRPSIWGDALWALVQNSPIVEDASETYDEATKTATCRIKRKERREETIQKFSEADAKLAGLWGKQGPWSTNPRRMLQMRARAFAARDAVPDVLKGLAVAEEALDIPPEREINPATTEPVRGTAALAAARERAKAAEIETRSLSPASRNALQNLDSDVDSQPGLLQCDNTSSQGGTQVGDFSGGPSRGGEDIGVAGSHLRKDRSSALGDVGRGESTQQGVALATGRDKVTSDSKMPGSGTQNRGKVIPSDRDVAAINTGIHGADSSAATPSGPTPEETALLDAVALLDNWDTGKEVTDFQAAQPPEVRQHPDFAKAVLKRLEAIKAKKK